MAMAKSKFDASYAHPLPKGHSPHFWKPVFYFWWKVTNVTFQSKYPSYFYDREGKKKLRRDGKGKKSEVLAKFSDTLCHFNRLVAKRSVVWVIWQKS
jgi:hypothetical protein